MKNWIRRANQGKSEPTQTFLKYKILLCNPHLPFPCVTEWSSATYGSPVIWRRNMHTKSRSISRLEAFEMWTIRRMLEISWTQKLRNSDVLEKTCMEKQLLTLQYKGAKDKLCWSRSPRRKVLIPATATDIGGKNRKMKTWNRSEIIVLWHNFRFFLFSFFLINFVYLICIVQYLEKQN